MKNALKHAEFSRTPDMLCSANESLHHCKDPLFRILPGARLAHGFLLRNADMKVSTPNCAAIHLRFRLLCVPASLLLFSSHSLAQTKVQTPAAARDSGERRAARNLDAARANPLQLRNLLLKMPKGADLHNHLSGAVYAESWIRAAVEDRLCVNLSTLSFAKPQPASDSEAEEPSCAAGRVPAAEAYKNQQLFDSLIDAFSMRGFVPSPGVTGHDHFFETFEKFGGTDHRHLGEWLDEVATRADSQNEQYLELMHTPEFGHTAAIAYAIGWNEDFAQLRNELLARGLRDDTAPASAAVDRAEELRRQREHCGQRDASTACRVQIRYLCQVLRGFPKQQVFAQTLLCFETASADPRFVGINFVMPEDGYISMSDYVLHMRMIAFLRGLYPKVHLSLHAGELAPGLVPYEGLCCHIRLAIEEAKAERIGHGVDVMYETHPHELLKEMARRHVMAEINLTSNDVILGVSGKDHPFPLYRLFRVPVALATDDEGVSRIDLTHEYVRAVQTYGLSYSDLKQMVRTSLEHSFLPGASLWSAPDEFSRPAAACSKDSFGKGEPSSACAAFLKSSEKASQQWELERRFGEFEAAL
jgi:adenosine deaminase